MPRGDHGQQPRGSKHPRWNNGGIISSDGYKKVRVGKTHPLSDPNGYAFEHHVVWVSAGNKVPSKGMVLHHINEDKMDNRIENLKLVTIDMHNIEHGRKKLSRSDISTIRDLYSSGVKQKELSERFGVAHQTVSKIIRGEARKNDPGTVSNIDNRKRGEDGRYE